MTETAPRHRYTYVEYLRFEEAANVRHEYFDGEIYAMAGGTPEHAVIAANVIALLGAALRDGPCRVFTSDLRIRVLATGLATYPDVTVVCGEIVRDPDDANTVTNPTLIVEVLSPSTAEYDRNEKLGHYRRIPSLREVILVAHDERLLEVWRRDDTGWVLEVTRQGTARLASVGVDLAVADVYTGS